MIRPAGVFAALLLVSIPAWASVTRPPTTPFRLVGVVPFATASADASATESFGDLSLTTDTEVVLDGRACEYKQVPEKAMIVRIELAPDRKTILKIEFSSKK